MVVDFGFSLLGIQTKNRLPAEDVQFALFAQRNLEAGILVFPFMQVIAFCRMRYSDDFMAAEFNNFVPVAEAKIFWGAF